MTKNPLVRPYLKWAGGKGQLKGDLKDYFPKKADVGTYYEPFIGAGAMFFEHGYEKAVINDTNSDLMTTYRIVKNNLNELIPKLKEYEKKNNGSDYYVIREQDRNKRIYDSLSDVEKTARFIYLNKTCYNGLYRVNSQGHFNTPFGNYKNPAICNENVLSAVSKFLNEKDIKMECKDFEECVKKCVEGDFVYFDPPYHSPDNTNFTGYQSGGFNEREQERLFNVFKKLTNKGVKCTLSNASTDFINKLYQEYEPKEIKASRQINSDPNGRGLVDEVVVINWGAKK